MQEDPKTKFAEVKPNDSRRNDEALSPLELSQISGGIQGESEDKGFKNE